jgi:hypothetical protein
MMASCIGRHFSRFGEPLQGEIAEVFLEGGKPGSSIQARPRLRRAGVESRCIGPSKKARRTWLCGPLFC